MCSLVPSLTLYGTTQLTITPSLLPSTYLGAPTQAQSVVYYPQCNPAGGECVQTSKTTLVPYTPVFTTTIPNAGGKEMVITIIVPQQTLYYPCSSESEVVKESSTQAPVESSSKVEPISVVFQQTSSFFGVFTTGVASAGVSSSAIPSSTSSMTSPSPTLTPTSTVSSPGISQKTQAQASQTIGSTTLSNSNSENPSTPSTPSSDTTPSNTSSPDTSPTPTHAPHTRTIIVSITAYTLALLLLCLSCFCWRRKNDRDSDNDEDEGGVEDDYWERRFRALEAGSSGSGEKHFSQDQDGGEGVKKLRLTLDLGSKSLPSRPASRLSSISSFFAKPQPLLFTKRSSSKPTPIFSRPRFGRRVSSYKSRTSGSEERREGMELRRSGSMKCMEWIRGIEENGLVGQREAGENGGYPGVRELRRISVGVSGLSPVMPGSVSPVSGKDEGEGKSYSRSSGGLLKPKNSPLRGSFGTQKSYPSGSSSKSKRTTPSRVADTTLLTVPGERSRTNSTGNDSGNHNSRTSSAAFSTISSEPSISASRPTTQHTPRTLYPRRKTPPTLNLSRDALTPSLWVDDELYDQFQAGQREEKLEISEFSPESSLEGTVRGSVQPEDGAYGGLASATSDGVERMKGLEGLSPGSSVYTRESKGGLSAEWERDQRSAVTPRLTPRLPDVNLDLSGMEDD